MSEYKPLYVKAGKREDGTYGVMRTCGNMVMVYNTKEDTEKKIDNSSFEEIVLDIGTIVDRNLFFGIDGKPHHGWLDISSRRK